MTDRKIDFSLEDVRNGLPAKNYTDRNWLEVQGIDFRKVILLNNTDEYIKKVDFEITLSKDGVEIE